MRTISSTDLRKNLAETLDQVNDDHCPVIVTRANGKPAVLLSLEDYSSMDETAYLSASPANREQLLKAIEELERGEGVTKDLIEP
jgi:antitoxin YefM